jgi:hypothetical protein
MNNEHIKKLAKYSLGGKKVNLAVAGFVLNKLSRKELIAYLRYLKAIVDRETVRIISKEPISAKLKKTIEHKFGGKTLVFEEDKSLGPGIKAVMNDSVVDLTFGGYLNQTITNLKEKL